MKKYLLLFWFTLMTILMMSCGQSINQVETNHTETEQEKIVQEEHESAVVNMEVDPEDDKQPASESSDKPEINANEPLSDLTAHFIDVGQGDATLFQFTSNGEPFTILYDAGHWTRHDVVNYLSAQNISYIDLIIISHPHADHIGQLAQIMSSFEVGEVWMSGNTTTSRTFQAALEAVLASDADYYEPRAGEVFDIGNLVLEILHPDQLTGKLNEDSISARLTYGNVSFVITGDALKNEELAMINRVDNIQAQILRLGHHGSNTSTHPTFLEAVQPEIAIYSAGLDNQYGHPHREVVSRIQEMDIPLYGTDVHGTIVVTTDGLSYTMSTNKTGTVEASDYKQPESNEKQENKPSQSQSETTTTTHCIDINEASMEELQQIIHIGPARAEELITLRPFKSVDGLVKIHGIGKGRMKDIKAQGLACVGG